MEWLDLVPTVTTWTQKAAAIAPLLRRVVSPIYTSESIGCYYNPVTEKIALYATNDDRGDRALILSALGDPAPDTVHFLSYQDLSDPNGTWVKVAYSPTLRRTGEILNFFPGQYVNGMPNAPSPLAAMLTSGLVGAGLGWGTGKLVEKLLPEQYGKRLGRTGAIIGGALGAVPGAAWAGMNHVSGKSLNDSSLLAHNPGEEPELITDNGYVPGQTPTPFMDLAPYLEHIPHRLKHGEAEVELPADRVTANIKVASAFGQFAPSHAKTPADVNVNALGQTLWEYGAQPALAASTMGTMYAAQQMPDPHASPAWVTGNQLGQLAQQTIGDYTKGYLAGAAINAVIGTPHKPSTFGVGNVVLGVIGAVIPKLYGA